MLTYQFTTNDNVITTIDIELLRTPFVDSWREYISALAKRVPNIIWYICRIGNTERHYAPSQIIQFLSRLYACFLYFEKKKIGDFSADIKRIEYLFLHPNELIQKDLNTWHRHFTTLEHTHSMKPYMTPPNTHMMDLYEYIHDVNQFSHRCEAFTYYECKRRKLFPNPNMYSVMFTNANNMAFLADNDNNKVWDVDTPRIYPGSYDFLNENHDCTVWLHEDIIGKDQIKAWLDEDDLNEFDIGGNDCMTPNITFDPNKLFHRVLSNEDFIRESKLSNKTLDRPPLGNIINLSDINWNTVLNSKVKNIKLDGNTLWNYESIL